jgi:hypothetical protein
MLVFAGVAFASDKDDSANKKSTTPPAATLTADSASSATHAALPNSDALASPAPTAPVMMIKPAAPVVAPAHGFLPMIRGAMVPRDTSPAEQRAWVALSLMAHGAAAFDAYSTRASVESGRGYERNPLMKPFAGSAAMYPAAQVLPFGLDYLSRRMMHSDNTLLRHTWWLPQLAATAGSTWVGIRNLHVAQ